MLRNPTPPNDPIANIRWKPVEGNQQYYEIGPVVATGSNPLCERMAFWNDMEAMLSSNLHSTQFDKFSSKL